MTFRKRVSRMNDASPWAVGAERETETSTLIRLGIDARERLVSGTAVLVAQCFGVQFLRMLLCPATAGRRIRLRREPWADVRLALNVFWRCCWC